MAGPLITAANLRLTYPGFELRVANLSLAAGEILAVLGPSGAGKSTLLRIMAGLPTPEIGQVVSPVPPLFLPQTPVILSGSVLTNAAFGLRLRGVKKRLAQERAAVWLETLGLAAKAHRSAATLSGGERRRLALARLLACEAPLVLLDEPTAELDPANVSLIEKVLSDFRFQGGSVVLVSHNIFQARRLADRCLLLWNGEVIDHLPTRDFFMAPGDPRTQAFVAGKMIY